MTAPVYSPSPAPTTKSLGANWERSQSNIYVRLRVRAGGRPRPPPVVRFHNAPFHCLSVAYRRDVDSEQCQSPIWIDEPPQGSFDSPRARQNLRNLTLTQREKALILLH